MSIVQQSRRERLWFPANGISSSELEVLSAPGLRRKRAIVADKFRRIERSRKAYQMNREENKIIERAKAIPLVIHRSSQECTSDEPPLIDADCHWPVTIRDICRASCRHYNINILDFVSKRRHARLVRARHVAMYIARKYTTRTLPEIARIMGGRDHTTIMHGAKRITDLLVSDEALQGDINTLLATLGIEVP